MDYQRKIAGTDELVKVAQDLVKTFPNDRIYVLDAPMGMGKTTFVKAFCETHMQTHEVVNSPTFAILNVYTTDEENIFHFDFYRLESKEEALDIGIDDYLHSGSYCFIEWPDLIMDYLPESYIHIRIEGTEYENERIFKADKCFL